MILQYLNVKFYTTYNNLLIQVDNYKIVFIYDSGFCVLVTCCGN